MNQKGNKISIIVPAYNIENEIARCIKSILAQTYDNIEIIIVNDGSTDGTSNIIHNLEVDDNRIKVIDKENEGVTKARLTGVEVASGDWIGFVDGDDYIECEMYECLIQNAIKYDADISHCGYQMVFPSRVDYYYNTGKIVEQDNITGLKDLLSGSFIEPGLWNKLFHKTLFHSLLHEDVIDLSIKNNEDLLMNYYLFKESKKSIYEDFCPYHYIVRGDSAANKQMNEHQLLDPIRVVNILDNETKNISQLNDIISEKKLRYLIGMASMHASVDRHLIQPYKIRAIRILRKDIIKILKKNTYGLKLKLMTLVVYISPSFYRWIHDVYEKVTGIDKIYDIS